MRKSLASALCVLAVLGQTDSAAAAGIPWRSHAPPFTFLFGNDIDTHQQTRADRNGDLFGFLYLKFSGVVTADGFPVASHADCGHTTDCRAGWIIRGRPGSGRFLYHVEPDHPVWQVSRAAIPQPGAQAHFHFLGAHPSAAGESRPGYFLELFATEAFCFLHDAAGAVADRTCEGNGGVAVTPGLDIATHVNIVTSFPDGGSGM